MTEDRKFIQTKIFKLFVTASSLLTALFFSLRIRGILGSGFGKPMLLAVFAVTAVMILIAVRFLDRTDIRSGSLIYAAVLGIMAAYSLMMFSHPGKSLLWLLLYIFCAAVIRTALSRSFERRVSVLSFITALILSTFAFLGTQMHNSGGFYIYLLLIIEYAGFFFLLYCGLQIVFQYLCDNDLRCGPAGKSIDGEKSSLPYFFAVMAGILICWLPYFIIYYPGTMSSDSFGEINQYTGISPLSNHHPIIHQLFIRLCLRVCELFTVSGSTEHITLSAAVYSALQMLIMAAIVSGLLVFLRRKGVSVGMRAAVFCFFALLSVNAYFSITMTKDVLFGGITILLMIKLIRETDEEPETGKDRFLGTVVLILISFLFCTFRNNGYYAFLAGMPVFIIVNRKQWKRLLVVFLAVVIAVAGYKFLLFDILNIEKSKDGMTLSVPLQQIARVANQSGSCDSAEFEVLREVIPDMEAFGESYDPVYAGPVLKTYREHADVFQRNPKRYIKAWLSLGIKNPAAYVEAFMMQSYGYWYPDVSEWTALTTIYRPNDYGVVQNERFSAQREKLTAMHDSASHQEPLSVLFSIGLNVWILVASWALLIVKRQRNAAAAVVILAAEWLTVLASPKYCEFRYIYSIIVSTPMFAALAAYLPDNRMRGTAK